MRRRKASSADRGEIAELGTSSYGEILKEFKKEDHSFDFEEINDDESICEGVVNDATVDEETNNDEINDEEAIVEESIDDEANGEEINE